MYILYGIPGCNSVQKARTWLDRHKIEYTFHDYKKEGISRAKLNSWCKQLGWETVLNKNGTTWRALDEATQQSVNSQAAAVDLMLEHNSSIKRPIITLGDKVVAIRFNEAAYEETFLGVKAAQ